MIGDLPVPPAAHVSGVLGPGQSSMRRGKGEYDLWRRVWGAHNTSGANGGTIESSPSQRRASLNRNLNAGETSKLNLSVFTVKKRYLR
jgi:hypothetical protein